MRRSRRLGFRALPGLTGANADRSSTAQAEPYPTLFDLDVGGAPAGNAHREGGADIFELTVWEHDQQRSLTCFGVDADPQLAALEHNQLALASYLPRPSSVTLSLNDNVRGRCRRRFRRARRSPQQQEGGTQQSSQGQAQAQKRATQRWFFSRGDQGLVEGGQ